MWMWLYHQCNSSDYVNIFSLHKKTLKRRNDSTATVDTHVEDTWTYIYNILYPSKSPKTPLYYRRDGYVGVVLFNHWILIMLVHNTYMTVISMWAVHSMWVLACLFCDYIIIAYLYMN